MQEERNHKYTIAPIKIDKSAFIAKSPISIQQIGWRGRIRTSKVHFRGITTRETVGRVSQFRHPPKGPVFYHELRNRKTFAYVTTGDRVPIIKRTGQRLILTYSSIHIHTVQCNRSIHIFPQLCPPLINRLTIWKRSILCVKRKSSVIGGHRGSPARQKR